MNDTTQEPLSPDEPAPSPVIAREPGVRMALSQGWQAMKSQFLIYFLAVLVLAAFLLPFNIYDEGNRGRDSGLLALIETAYMLLLYPVIQYGADLLFLRGVRGDARCRVADAHVSKTTTAAAAKWAMCLLHASKTTRSLISPTKRLCAAQRPQHLPHPTHCASQPISSLSG